MTNLKTQLQQHIKDGQALMAKIEAEEMQQSSGKRWRAQENCHYHYIDHDGRVEDSYDARDDTDNHRYSIGNYHQTRGQAEAYRQKLIDLQVLKDDAGEWGWKPGDEYFCVECATLDVHLVVNSNWVYSGADVRFQTREAAVKSVRIHGAEWQRVLGVEVGCE